MDLKINHLSVSYKTNEVIRDISLCVDKGSFFTILGKSGSGKSTILKAIAGLHTNQTGQIHLGEEEISRLAAEHRHIAYVFQKPLLFPHLSVEDNIAFGPEIHNWPKATIQACIRDLVKLVQIEGLEKRMPNQISGGQQQRAAIARALALNHKVLLMDEPFSSLDPKLRQEMGQLVKDIQKRLNLTVIFVTHDVEEAMHLSDRICFLSQGKLIQCGTPDTLYNYPATTEISDFMGDTNWIRGRVTKGHFTSSLMSFDVADLDDGSYHLLLRPHDLSINEDGKGYSILSSRRVGKETVTKLTNDGDEMVVSELKDHVYNIGTVVGLNVINDYKHLVPR